MIQSEAQLPRLQWGSGWPPGPGVGISQVQHTEPGGQMEAHRDQARQTQRDRVRPRETFVWRRYLKNSERKAQTPRECALGS